MRRKPRRPKIKNKSSEADFQDRYDKEDSSVVSLSCLGKHEYLARYNPQEQLNLPENNVLSIMSSQEDDNTTRLSDPQKSN